MFPCSGTHGGDQGALALAFAFEIPLSLAFALVPARCCSIGLEGLLVVVDVVELALGLPV